MCVAQGFLATGEPTSRYLPCSGEDERRGVGRMRGGG